MVTVNDYFRYCIKEEYLTTLKFFYSTMTIPLHTKNDYYKIENNKYYVKMGNSYEEVMGKTSKEPLLVIKEPITLFNADLPNIATAVETTIGKAIMNYVLLTYNFKHKIPYINGKNISAKQIETIVADNLKKDVITVQEYINFVDACNLIQALSRITTVSATMKTMTPPPGIDKYKKELYQEFSKKYGNTWTKDMVRVIEFQELLKAKDAEYLADDPTNGKLTSGKVKDNARAKMYLAFGVDAGFTEDASTPPELVFNSLLEGYPEDKKQLTVIYNSSRAGSFSRGFETREGGTVAKKLLRSTSDITIHGEDCGSTIGKELYVTEDIAPSLVGRYMLENNKPILIEDSKKLIGKTIYLRSPQYCKRTDKSICKICAGKNLSEYEKGVTILATDISSTLMTIALKKMHTSVKKLVKVNPIEMLK